MGKLKLQHKYDDVRKYLESMSDNEMAAIIAKEQKNVREGISDERRKECVAYGMYFHIEDEALRDYMRNFIGKNTYSNLHWYQLIENSK